MQPLMKATTLGDIEDGFVLNFLNILKVKKIVKNINNIIIQSIIYLFYVIIFKADIILRIYYKINRSIDL